MADLTTTPNAAPGRKLGKLEKVHRRWVRIQSGTPRKLWGEDAPLSNARGMCLVIALLLGVLCSFPDAVLLPKSFWPDSALSSPATGSEASSFVHHVDGWRLAAVLILLSLFNGWLLDLALSDQTPGKPPWAWVRALRWLAGSVPPLALAVPGLWYLLFRKHRDRLESSDGPRPASPGGRFLVALAERVTSSGRRFLATEWTFYWVLITNLVLPFVGVLWLSNPAEMTRGRYAAIVLAAVVGHLAAFAGASYYFAGLRQEQTEKWRRRLLVVLPVFWLVPVPLVFFLGLFPLFLVRTTRGDDTLTAGAHGERGSVSRLSTWRNLEATLRSGWSEIPWWRRWFPAEGVERPATLGVEQTRLLWLYEGKSAVLLFETVFFAGWLGPASDPLVMAAGLGALFVGGVALAVHLVYVVLQMGRSSRWQILGEHPYAFFVAVTQLLFFMGCFLAVSRRRGDEEAIAGILLAAGALCLLAVAAGIALPMPQRVRRAPVELVIWAVLFYGLAATGLTMHTGAEGMEMGLNLMDFHARLHPLLSVLIGGLLGDWLLRPFRQAEPSRRRRLLLAGLTLTAVAPLGGLFVPWWIYLRHRLATRQAPGER